jgi:hypothetical protein
MLKPDEVIFIKALLSSHVTPARIVYLFRQYFGYSVSRRTIFRVKYPRSKANQKRGPKRRTTTYEDDIMEDVVLRNRFKSWRDIVGILRTREIHVSTSILRSRMKERGIQGRVAKKKPALSEDLAHRRLEWCRSFAGLPDDFFQHIVFADEASINLLCEDSARVWVKRRRHEALSRKTVKRKYKFRVFIFNFLV